MTSPNEQLKLQQFKKMSHSLSRKNRIPFDVQKKRITDDLKYHQYQIILACRTQDNALFEKTVQKIIQLFADRSVIKMEENKELYGELSPEVLEEEVNRYSSQCARFLDTVEALKETYA